MEAHLEKIREVQKEAWNKSSIGWKKWDGMVMNFLQPLNPELIRMMSIRETDHILDVATGTGEPALSIARLVPSGQVTATDLSEEMLVVAKEKAESMGIRNLDTVCCDASALDFDDNTFDAVVCRMGLMFVPDLALAIQEMVRVLKSGGRLAVSVWGDPDRNPWIRTSMEVMIARLGLNVPPPGAPGLFRCAEPGSLASLFRNAGLKNIEETTLGGTLSCGSQETYWGFITEVASPMAYAKAEDALKQEIKEEILGRVRQKAAENNVLLGSYALLVSGEK